LGHFAVQIGFFFSWEVAVHEGNFRGQVFGNFLLSLDLSVQFLDLVE
jgi:hypothetical protein